MKRNLADKIQRARIIELIVAHRHLIFNEYDFNGLTRQLIPVDIQEYHKTAAGWDSKHPSVVVYLLKHPTDRPLTELSRLFLMPRGAKAQAPSVRPYDYFGLVLVGF